jgi:hypothetical protein
MRLDLNIEGEGDGPRLDRRRRSPAVPSGFPDPVPSPGYSRPTRRRWQRNLLCQ